MADIIDKIKNRYKQGDILTRIIFINVLVFVLLLLLSLLRRWFFLDFKIEAYTAIPSHIEDFINVPWTIFTYMFVHYDVLHILFNMLFLYGFGRLFLMHFNPKQFGSLYILGGFGGAVLYLLIYNLIPYFVQTNASMVGASASAMAIVFAVAFYLPDLRVNLFLLGRIKLLYIAIALFLIDTLFVSMDSNVGGHIAHIGGALVGGIFAWRYKNGKDITKWITNVIDKIVNLFKPSAQKRMKVKYKKPKTDAEYNQQKVKNTEEIDNILDKIKASGYSSLNKDEKKRLFDASKDSSKN